MKWIGRLSDNLYWWQQWFSVPQLGSNFLNSPEAAARDGRDLPARGELML
jgi:hypothetical protein